MPKSVAEFMDKSIKTYACGEKAQQAKNVLTAAFTASDKRKQNEESAEFARLIDLVMQTDKGRDTLTELSELGYTFTFEKGNFGGFCEPTSKKIAVNPNFGDGYALQTIVHEGQHAIQAAHEPENTPKTEQLNIASLLRRERAMEADACAHEAAFTYQCRDVLPEVYAEAEKNDMPMFRAFVAKWTSRAMKRNPCRQVFRRGTAMIISAISMTTRTGTKSIFMPKKARKAAEKICSAKNCPPATLRILACIKENRMCPPIC